MEGIYVSVLEVQGSSVLCDIDSTVVFFVYRYLNHQSTVHPALNIVIDACEGGKPMKVDISGFGYSIVHVDDLHEDIQNCHLPVYYLPEKNYCIAGFCAVLRQVSKNFKIKPVPVSSVSEW